MAKFEGSSPPSQGRIKAEDFIKWTKLKVRGPGTFLQNPYDDSLYLGLITLCRKNACC